MPKTTARTVKNVISSNEDANLEELNSVENVKKRSVKGVLSYMAQTFANFGISIVANFLLGSFLNPEEFGVYFIVTSVMSLFTFLADIGFASSLIQKKEEPTTEELRTAFTIQQALSIGIFVLIAVLTPYWQSVQKLSQQELYLLYLVAASFFFITFKTIPSVLLNRRLRFDLLALPAVAENLVFYTTVCILAYLKFGIMSYFWAILLRDIVGIVFIYRLQSWPIGIGFSQKSFRGLIKFGFKFQLNDLLARIKDDLLTVVITSAWLTKDELGYLSWARKYAAMPQQFTVSSVAAVTFPTYSRLQHNPEMLSRAIEKTLYFITLAAIPLLIGISIFMRPLVELVESYNKWEPALLALALFAYNIAWSTLSTPLTNTLNAIGHVNKTLGLMIMWTVLTWVLTPLCIRYFGFNGVAMASALIGMSSVVTIIMVKRVVSFSLWKNIWRQLLAGSFMLAFGVAGLPYWDNSWIHFFVGGSLTGCIFVIVFLLIGWKSLKTELTSLGLWPTFLP